MIHKSNLEEFKRSPLWSSTPLFYIKPFATSKKIFNIFLCDGVLSVSGAICKHRHISHIFPQYCSEVLSFIGRNLKKTFPKGLWKPWAGIFPVYHNLPNTATSLGLE